ncbi:ovarian-specific serine/threonine-protein kinase Lok-like [Pseudomyrmex gracilis]|uniref:ovarian-specific serine/threonine-protein kinase Lok-like n=1 Tax=Pseudomyrmex gracilis TaxID=219809 RepID=UPI0009959751|nr:ovarian-specific serine/threonine-protein kinase Lok-like [Pseudomyrmex gracilis]XP_020296849.1 ovarian-specific serine/threonine-protein kinase Lok-like [Pseudomyrmex gracilis]
MASQDIVSASQLPDTQNIDLLTQSQDTTSTQLTLKTWGQLHPLRSSLKGLDMMRDGKNNGYTLGRSEHCDIHICTDHVNLKWLNVISKVHFSIYRDKINNTNETVVYLEDKSQNGTFVNKVKVGRGNRVIIENKAEIALAKETFSVYIFINTLLDDSLELPLKLKQKYTLGRKLGSGAYGEVRMIFTKDGSKQFAIKIIQKPTIISTGNPFHCPEKIWNEGEILKQLRHPCIIHMEDIYDSPTTLYIILELMMGGELYERIKNKGKLSEPCAKLIFYQVVLAVYYLHKNGITHRDLKPENILLKSNSDKTLVKVSDFGMSKLVSAQSAMKTFCGTLMYVAPEILKTFGRETYTNQVDVWSLGVILYICLSGICPFNPNREDVTLEVQIMQGLYKLPDSHFGNITSTAKELIKRMLTVDPKKRITVKQILLHPWLKDAHMREEVQILIKGNKCMENDENTPPFNIFKRARNT